MLILLLKCFISVSDQDSELYPQFSTRIDIPEFKTEGSFHSAVNVSQTNCKIMESLNIYQNTQLKKAKYANKHFLEILNTHLKFEILYPNEWKNQRVTYPIAKKIKVLGKYNLQ